MNIVRGALVILVVTVLAVTTMLLVRRRAPEGGYFADGDRASGVFGVIATGFSVLLGFIVFLTFTTYDSARAGAEDEAIIVVQQVVTAQSFPDAVRGRLTGELVCYARFVAGEEWGRLEDGTFKDGVNPWAARLFGTFESVVPETDTEQTAYDKWVDQTSDREQARNDRLHGSDGVIPTPLWYVLFFVSAIIFVYMLFFADSGERAVVQGLLMGSVVAVICALLLILAFLNDPFHDGVGALKPTAMERTLHIADQAIAVAQVDATPPCTPAGRSH